MQGSQAAFSAPPKFTVPMVVGLCYFEGLGIGSESGNFKFAPNPNRIASWLACSFKLLIPWFCYTEGTDYLYMDFMHYHITRAKRS